MVRTSVVLLLVVAALAGASEARAASAETAALQVGLAAVGLYSGPIDGVPGPLTSAGVRTLERRHGLPADGKVDRRVRRALGALGAPDPGAREATVGAVGWDVSVLEFRLLGHGLPSTRVDGRFDRATRTAVLCFQRAAGLDADGIAGPLTFKALRRPVRLTTPVPARAPVPAPAPTPVRAQAPAVSGVTHVVRAGDSLFAIATLHGVPIAALVRENGLKLSSVILPGQRLRVPTTRAGADPTGATMPSGSPAQGSLSPSQKEVRTLLDRWSAAYGVDPQLARAVAWNESGWRNDVVSSAGARGVMQLLPGTWDWVATFLIAGSVPDTAEGNVRVGVRYLKWLLDEFRGDIRLALAGYYQGPHAVRTRGLFEDTKRYIATVLGFYGEV